MSQRNLPTALAAAIKARTPATDLVGVAKAFIGVTAQGNPELVNLFRSVVGQPVNQPWCLDFIQACLAYVEATTGVGSPLPATELCTGLFALASPICGVSTPLPGDLIVWVLGSTGLGHVGILTDIGSITLGTVEGNTTQFGHVGEIDRDGDGVWSKTRAKGGSATFKQLGFLRPFP